MTTRIRSVAEKIQICLTELRGKPLIDERLITQQRGIIRIQEPEGLHRHLSAELTAEGHHRLTHFTPAGGHQDDPIRPLDPVNGGGSRILQDRNVLYLVGIDPRELGIAVFNVIHQYIWLLAVFRKSADAPDEEIRTIRTRPTAALHRKESGQPALQGILKTGGWSATDIITLDLAHGTGLRYFSLTAVTHDDHILQGGRILLKGQIQDPAALCGNLLGLISNAGNDQDGPRWQILQYKGPAGVGDGTRLSILQHDVHISDGLAGRIPDDTARLRSLAEDRLGESRQQQEHE